MQEEADCVSDVLTVSVNKPVNLSKPVTFLLANNGTKVCFGTGNKTHTICVDSSECRIIGFANMIHITNIFGRYWQNGQRVHKI